MVIRPDAVQYILRTKQDHVDILVIIGADLRISPAREVERSQQTISIILDGIVQHPIAEG